MAGRRNKARFSGSQVVSSKQPKLGLTQELSFSRISESFYFPWHWYQMEGTTGF